MASSPSYASFGAFTAQPGKTDELVSVLADAARMMSGYPGCEEYRVYRDAEQDDRIWVSERWTSEEAHESCLHDPAVREAISRGMPLIAGISNQVKLIPVA